MNSGKEGMFRGTNMKDKVEYLRGIEQSVKEKELKQYRKKLLLLLSEHFSIIDLAQIHKNDMYQTILDLLNNIYKAESIGLIHENDREIYLDLNKVNDNLAYLEVLLEEKEFDSFMNNRK